MHTSTLPVNASPGQGGRCAVTQQHVGHAQLRESVVRDPSAGAWYWPGQAAASGPFFKKEACRVADVQQINGHLRGAPPSATRLAIKLSTPAGSWTASVTTVERGNEEKRRGQEKRDMGKAISMSGT